MITSTCDGSRVIMSVAKHISQVDDRTLKIVWDDGKESIYDVLSLRRNCPCAECTNGNRGTVDDSVRPVEIKSVGRYALQISFTDGHRTGIYSFANLRKTSA